MAHLGRTFIVVVLDNRCRAPAVRSLVFDLYTIGPGDIGVGAVITIQGFFGHAIEFKLALKAADAQLPGFIGTVFDINLVQRGIATAQTIFRRDAIENLEVQIVAIICGIAPSETSLRPPLLVEFSADPGAQAQPKFVGCIFFTVAVVAVQRKKSRTHIAVHRKFNGRSRTG